MRGKVAQIDWQDDEIALKQAYLREADPLVKPRLHLLWLVRQGKQIKEAAALIGVHLRTGRQWVSWYRDGGLVLVRQKKKGGKGQSARLSPEQQQAFLAWARAEGFSTALEACRYVDEQFGVSYSQAGMYGLLSRLKVRKKVPRPMNAKADEETQEAYKKRA